MATSTTPTPTTATAVAVATAEYSPTPARGSTLARQTGPSTPASPASSAHQPSRELDSARQAQAGPSSSSAAATAAGSRTSTSTTTAGGGGVRRRSVVESRRTGRAAVTDFLYGKLLGEGAFARVLHAAHRDSGSNYAVKIVDKRQISKLGKRDSVMMERNVMGAARHHCVTRLCYTFQTSDELFFAMDLCRAGDLFSVIRTFKQQLQQQQQAHATAAATAAGAGAGATSDAPGDGGSQPPTPAEPSANVDADASTSNGTSATAPSTATATTTTSGSGSSSGSDVGRSVVPLSLSRFYMAQCVSALEYLHTRLGVIHLDFKVRLAVPCPYRTVGRSGWCRWDAC